MTLLQFSHTLLEKQLLKVLLTVFQVKLHIKPPNLAQLILCHKGFTFKAVELLTFIESVYLNC